MIDTSGVGAAIVLALVHLLAERGWLRKLRRGSWLSFAGGAAAAYVFLYILPILSDTAYELSFENGFSPNGEWIFVAAFVGMCVFHAVEIRARRIDRISRPRGNHRFWLQIAAFSLYNLLVGALFVIKPYASFLDGILYQSALLLHFAALDLSMRERHPHAYDGKGRWLMAGSVVLGWALGHLGVTHPFIVGPAFAFLAGAMILNVLKDELAETESSYLGAFLFGSAVYAALFLIARID